MLLIVALAAMLAVPVVAVAADRFTDVPDTHPFHDDISWLASAGVTLGCNPPTNDRFCPDDPVKRQQMAAFMRRFAQYLGAEDGIVNEADHAATAGDAGTLDGLTAEDLIDSSPLVIHAADFGLDGGGSYGDYYLSWASTGWRVDVANFGCLQAPVPLPNGATLTSVDIAVLDQAGDGFYAYHTAALGDPTSLVEILGSSSASGTVQTVSLDVSALTASNANQNWIGVCLRSVGDVLYGATVTYSITDASIASVPTEVKLGDPVEDGRVNGS